MKHNHNLYELTARNHTSLQEATNSFLSQKKKNITKVKKKEEAWTNNLDNVQ